jgi:hypothetical protein
MSGRVDEHMFEQQWDELGEDHGLDIDDGMMRREDGSQLGEPCETRRDWSMPVPARAVRELGDFSLHPQGRPCGRPPAAAVLGRQTQPT